MATIGPNCPGLRTQDSVRPVELCQLCACWVRTSGPVISPHVVVKYGDGGQPILMCTRREPLAG